MSSQSYDDRGVFFFFLRVYRSPQNGEHSSFVQLLEMADSVFVVTFFHVKRVRLASNQSLKESHSSVLIGTIHDEIIKPVNSRNTGEYLFCRVFRRVNQVEDARIEEQHGKVWVYWRRIKPLQFVARRERCNCYLVVVTA